MKGLRNQLAFSAVITLAAWVICNTPAAAVELLVNGNLESSISPPGWSLTQSVTGVPGANVNATEQVTFANDPPETAGGLGLFLRPFAGNTGPYAGQNQKINAVLSQTVSGTAGRTYTFTGRSWFANGDGDPLTPNDGYPGGVDLLSSRSPSDPTPGDPNDPSTVPSPTETTFELAFLDSSLAVIGSPVVLDLRTEQMNDITWRTHTLMGLAPAGTTKVRVTAAANDMVDNFGFQSAYFDNFTLRDSVLPGTERLSNGNLNTVGPPNGYTVIQSPAGTEPTIGFRDFANHTPGGVQGLWLRSFAGGDGKLSQTVPGTAGGDYEFSAWSKWEIGYIDADPSHPEVQTFMTMEFLDASSAVVGAPVTLDLQLGPDGLPTGTDGQANDATWRQFSLEGTAPAGTASVRISAGATGMANSGFNPQSAFFDDFSLIATLAGLLGDFNGDSKVDAADYVIWRKNAGTTNTLPNDNGIGGTVGTAHYNLWRANFGNMAGSGAGAGAVPEPAAHFLALIGLLGVAGIRRSCDLRSSHPCGHPPNAPMLRRSKPNCLRTGDPERPVHCWT